LLEGYLRYSNHLVYLQQLLYSHWGYGYSVPGYHDGMSFGLGWGHLVLAVLVWVWAARNPELADRRVLRFFGVCAILLSVLMLQDSLWLWDHLPLIEYIQFPWRLLGPVAVCVALIVGALGPMLWSLRRWRWAGFAGAMALLIVPNLSHLHPQRFDDVNLALWTPRQIASRGVVGSTASEYAPRWVAEVPPYDSLGARVVSGSAQLRQIDRRPDAWRGLATANAPAVAEVPIAYFPGWKVRIDGRTVPCHPAERTGLIRFDVPGGAHKVEVVWERTVDRWIADGISLVSVLVLLGATIFRRSATGIGVRVC
jgi:hypothetical protein